MLFRNSNLNIAVLISASLHLLCIFLIAPVFNTGRIIEHSGNVSFLGSIIKKVSAVQERSFNLDKVSFMQKIERISDIASDKVDLTPPKVASKLSSNQLDKEEVLFKEDRYEHITSDFFQKNELKSRIKVKDSLVAGDAENRTILYRPELGKFFPLASGFNSDYNVSIKFKVSKYGFIENPECIVSSGSYEIDQKAIKYIRSWQFVPDYESAEDFQEGVVRVSF